MDISHCNKAQLLHTILSNTPPQKENRLTQPPLETPESCTLKDIEILLNTLEQLHWPLKIDQVDHTLVLLNLSGSTLDLSAYEKHHGTHQTQKIIHHLLDGQNPHAVCQLGSKPSGSRRQGLVGITELKQSLKSDWIHQN